MPLEKIVVVGGGPAGLAASLYAARAGLRPLVVAPPAGGQLLGKGVDVENYPGLLAQTGPGVVQLMRTQTRSFGTAFCGLKATAVNVSNGSPFQITLETKPGHPMSGQTINAATVVLATGADSKWLGVEGEHQFRGLGVSSCATCDGYLYRGRHLAVIGGGDSAMEDALVLARVASKVTVIHRRDRFRASSVLAQRVLENPKIEVKWNRQIVRFEGKLPANENDEGALERLVLLDTTGESGEEVLACAAAFVAIGHNPNTELFKGQGLDMDEATGYLTTIGVSSRTSIEGVFAAGDVADSVYRQAITSAGSGATAALDAERWLSERSPPPPPSPPSAQYKKKASDLTECRPCVDNGFGWSEPKHKCGRFANKVCHREL